MKSICLLFAFYILHFTSSAQTIQQKLQKAYGQFEADSQLKHAISSLYVINAKTGEVIFDKNSRIGLAPASTQKIITAATAFELLGKDYRYKTLFSLEHHELGHSMVVYANEDPTFGSWRFRSTLDTTIYKTLVEKIKREGYSEIATIIVCSSG